MRDLAPGSASNIASDARIQGDLRWPLQGSWCPKYYWSEGLVTAKNWVGFIPRVAFALYPQSDTVGMEFIKSQLRLYVHSVEFTLDTGVGANPGGS